MDQRGEANTRTGMIIGLWTTIIYGGLIMLVFANRA